MSIPLYALLITSLALLGLPLAHADDASPAAQSQVQPVLLTGRAMGTTYRIKYWGSGQGTEQHVHEAVETLLAEFDLQMSTYRVDSELSRFNRASSGEWFPVSRRTAYVAGEAVRYCELTGGALDVTVSPVLRLWRFDAQGKQASAPFQPPSDEEIRSAMSLVGPGRLRVRQDPPALWKEQAGVEVDFSALAPGFAVDLMIELLQSLGFADAMVECGGEVRAAGTRPGGTPWRIGVERARPAGERPLVRIVSLRDLALTTAGDYRNFRTDDKQGYTHIIDPRTGRALPYRGVSVTVVAETCLEADALDTALMVMGPGEGRRWCDARNIAAMFQYEEAGQPVVVETARFKKIFGP